MNERPSAVLVVGATGSVGRYAATEALRHGYAVRALVRDGARAARILPARAAAIRTIVRPGWFDYNQRDQRKIVMLQGDRRQSGTPADGVIARDEIARVFIDSLHTEAADHRTLELVAEHGAEQDGLADVFAALMPDAGGSFDAVADTIDLPIESEPEMFRDDLATITKLSLKAGT